MNISACLLLCASVALISNLRAAENLLANPSGRGGATTGWTIIASGGGGWAAITDSADGDGACFITSYDWCTRSQTIDLLAKGYTESFLDNSPPIQVRESFKGTSNTADKYFLRVELRDANGIVLDSWEAGKQATPLVANGNWREEQHLFENYPPGVRQIFWTDGGDDAEYWAGHYGTLLDAAQLNFADPAPTAIHLTPGTYPLNAPAGSLAGNLSTDDNPGSTHTYALVGQTQIRTLVATGSLWSYLDDGSDQGTAWKDTTFDASAWPTGNAELGYGESDEATPIRGLNSHYTNYFRHSFNMSAAEKAAALELTLRLKRDDGAVVYVNGTEVLRDSMPVGTVLFNTRALSPSDDGQLFHPFSIPASALTVGVNVIAVEIHQVNLTTSDASFDLDLVATEVGSNFDNALFQIDGDGLRAAQAGPAVPVTLGGTWTVNVKTIDNGDNALTQLLTVTGVPDPIQPPSAIAISPEYIYETDPVGTPVGDFIVTDGDTGDMHAFTLVPGAGSTDNALFLIQSSRLVTNSIFNAAAQPSVSVRVRATDRANLSFEQALTIQVRDINDPPTDITFTGNPIVANSAPGTLVGTLSTTDADTLDTHTYTFVPGTTRQTIFGFGEQWRFLDNGSDLGLSANWARAAFDDSAWKSGPGNFGYGDAQITPVDFGLDPANKHVTTYFRRSVLIPNPQSYESFELQVKRDDGVAVYLNGSEVARDNLTPNALAGNYASVAIGDTSETTPVSFVLPAGTFTSGSNILAAEIHQVTASSSDLTFDLALFGTSDGSGEAYFEITNGNEIRTNTAFASANAAPGSTLGLVIRSTDSRGEMIERAFSVLVSTNNPGDLDDDGLPDDWETLYFTTREGQNGDDDSDQDGLTNLQEYIFDTQPNNRNSRLQIQLTLTFGTSYTASWPSSAVRRYRLQTSTTLANGSWVDTAAGLRQGSGGTMSDSVPIAGAPTRHFRLLVEIP